MPSDGTAKAQSARELFLVRLAYKEGRLVDAAANKPIVLDTDEAWVVFSGKLDVFAVEFDEGRPVGARRHICRLEAGEAAFGLDRTAAPVGLLAVGVAGTRVARVKQTRLFGLATEQASAAEVAAVVDGWVAALGWGVTRGVPPKTCTLVEPGAEAVVGGAAPARAARGVVWVELEAGGDVSLVDASVPVEAGGPFPVTERTWLWAAAPATVRGIGTAALLGRGDLPAALGRFHDAAVRWLELGERRHAEDDQRRMRLRTSWHRQILSASTHRLASVLAPELPARSATVERLSAADVALRTVAAAEGISIARAPASVEGADHRQQAVAAARAAGVRMRQVLLRGFWWRSNNGPLLAFLADGERPVALVPKRSGRYYVHDPADGTVKRLRRGTARAIGPLAYQVYRPLPDGPIGGVDLLRFGLRGSALDLVRIAVFGLLGGLLSMVTPLAARALFDTVITGSHRDVLVQLTVLLLVAALAVASLQIAWSLALVRVCTRMELALQAAVWDRLLDLPLRFFRRYAAGDLANRVNAIMTIRQLLSESALTAMLAFLFCLPNVALLFYLDWQLAALGVALIAIAAVAAALTFSVQLTYQKRLYAVLGATAGRLLQLVCAIGKLHSTGTEGRAFASWAEDFVEQKEIVRDSRRSGMPLTVFNAVFPLAATTVLFAFVAFMRLGDMSTGSFVAFLVAFAAVLAPALQLSVSWSAALGAVPAYQRLAPVLAVASEADGERADPGELLGGIELNHVSFAYGADGPLVLEDVSLQIEPGEQVAIVGPSGSGKSTLFQLLMGFETPSVGSVYLDGKDLSSLDLRAVRRQMGVVLQRGQLMIGDVFYNIVGAATLPVEAAWDAARMAGIEDDIRSMPMQMHTFVCEGASTFSGGQRQRLLIARALATRPRIILFDEATSALDNLTQSVVSRSIAELQATRIVIAHRLSTIMNVDRIYVLDAGRVVQSGTYKELANQPGLFSTLVKRQLV